MTGPGRGSTFVAVLLPLVLVASGVGGPWDRSPALVHRTVVGADSSAVNNFSAALQRLVTLLGLSGSALLAIVWARVALSWFSNDLSKKIQAKDRARDALIGTLLFTAAFTGLAWGLARWVLTGG